MTKTSSPTPALWEDLAPGTRYHHPELGGLTIEETTDGWSRYTWDDPEMGTCGMRPAKLSAALMKCKREVAP